ncbi:MAG TPA: YihY/virulence factor BrkB family protein, partial [Streptosporangiaceae bacterium]
FAGLIWGATGLAQSGLFTMEQVWNLPGPARPGFVPRLGRAMLFIALLGGGLIVTTALASLNTYLLHGFWAVIGAEVSAAAFNVGMYIGGFRALTPKGVPTRRLLPGAITGGIMWTVLQVLGTWLVHHYLHSDSVYGIFGIVLGLLAWIYLAVQVTVYAAEINVVLTRRLWPRSILQPPLTEADRASMALQALQNQRRPEQHIEVTFDDREPSAAEPDQTGPDQTGPDQTGPTQVPRTPDEVAPPAEIPAEAAAEDRTEDRAAAAEVTVPGQRAEPELPAGRDPAQSDRTQ